MNKKIGSQIEKIVQASNDKWHLFTPDEPVVFAISGGKDSYSLLSVLHDYFTDYTAVHVSLSHQADLSFRGQIEQITKLHVIQTNIMEEVQKSSKNPCFICSRRRNQAIFEFAQNRGIKKVLFAHTREDVVETLFLNMIYASKISTMMPKQILFDKKIEVIRPFYEVPEVLLDNYAKDVDTIAKSCQFDGLTKRTYIKDLIKSIDADHKDIKVSENLYRSLLNIDLSHLPKK